MILFWILYRKVSLKYHRSVIGALMAFYRKSYGFSSKHQSVFLSKTTQIPIKFHRHVIMDKVFCISITSVFILLKFLLLFLQETCPLGASSVPHLSKQRSPIGQASCPFLCLFDLFFRKARCLIIMLLWLIHKLGDSRSDMQIMTLVIFPNVMFCYGKVDSLQKIRRMLRQFLNKI